MNQIDESLSMKLLMMDDEVEAVRKEKFSGNSPTRLSSRLDSRAVKRCELDQQESPDWRIHPWRTMSHLVSHIL
jgi:hypothetical protein